MSGAISIICLSVVGLLALAGVASRLYDDGMLERIGLSLISMWSFARVAVKFDDPYTEPVHLILHLGMLALALGITYKKWQHRHEIIARQRQMADTIPAPIDLEPRHESSRLR